MDSVEKVTVRLPPETISLLQVLVDRGDFRSLSDAVRGAVDEMVATHFSPEDISVLAVEHRGDDVLELGALVRSGSTASFDDDLRGAVRDFVRAKLGTE